jgi:hypothetical protein
MTRSMCAWDMAGVEQRCTGGSAKCLGEAGACHAGQRGCLCSLVCAMPRGRSGTPGY